MDTELKIKINDNGKRLMSSNEGSPVSDTNNDIRDMSVTDAWPRFLVMESLPNEKQINTLSPFVIEKAMKGICDAVDVKKLRSGALLIEVSRPAQAQNLLNQTIFATVPVKVTPHRTMNSCKGVIRDRDLADMNRDELVQELKCVGVTDARNIMQTRNGNKVKTAAIILTFARAILPKSIKAGYTNIKVSPYIPNPLRCFSCQGFGHHQSTCTRSKICAKCGQPEHGTDPCTGTPHCANCKGDHPSYSTSCPKWVKEKEICKVKVLHNVTYPEARKMVAPVVNETNNRITYSAMARPSVTTASVGTQTEIVNCTCAPKQIQIKSNTINKVSKLVKQASNQTEDIEQSEDKNADDVGTSSQEGWHTVGSKKGQGSARPHSLSPLSLTDNRGHGQRGRKGEPPDKQFRGSKSPMKSNKGNQNNMEKKALGATASSSHTGLLGTLTKIAFP
jgi:hypothetical protein